MRRLARVSKGAVRASVGAAVASRAAASSFDGGPLARPRGSGTQSLAGAAQREKPHGQENEAHPLLYNVPALSARTIGREAEVTALWQGLLSGRRCQVLVGVDGIGKSTIASAFSEAARMSGRFTCIQWFNARHALASQLESFFSSMRGRREKDVLLILDDVASPEDALSLLPDHKNVYVIMTSTNANIPQSTRVSVSATLPLSAKAAAELAVEVVDAEAADTVNVIWETLGFVPLLVTVASLLLGRATVSAAALRDVLVKEEVMKDNVLSISKALEVLLRLAVAELAKEYPRAPRQLATLSCFHLSDISDPVISAVCGDGGAQMAVAAAQLGIFTLKWEDSAFAIHPAVGAVLRKGLAAEDLCNAAAALQGMWPRRWRGMGSHLAYNLVWHSYALSGHFTDYGVPFSADLIASMDRSATYLAHNEARDLNIAATLWYAVFQQQQRSRAATREAVRVARECGRLLHFLRDERAHQVLQAAYDGAVAVHGQDSSEAALVLGCLAPYLEASEASVDRLARSAEVLEAHLTSADVVLSKEETKMLLETKVVLNVCRGQIMEEMGQVIPESLWESLDAAKQLLRQQQSKQ